MEIIQSREDEGSVAELKRQKTTESSVHTDNMILQSIKCRVVESNGGHVENT